MIKDWDHEPDDAELAAHMAFALWRREESTGPEADRWNAILIVYDDEKRRRKAQQDWLKESIHSAFITPVGTSSSGC